MFANRSKTSPCVPDIKVVLDNSSLSGDSDKSVNRLSNQSDNSNTELPPDYPDDQSSLQSAYSKFTTCDKMADILSTGSNESGVGLMSTHDGFKTRECDKMINRLSADSDHSGTNLMSDYTNDVKAPPFSEYANEGFETSDSGRVGSMPAGELVSTRTAGVKRPTSLNYANDGLKPDDPFVNIKDQQIGNYHGNSKPKDKCAVTETVSASETTIKDHVTKLDQTGDTEKVQSKTSLQNKGKEKETKSLDQEEKDPTNQIPPYINCVERNPKPVNDSQNVTYDYAETVNPVKTKPTCESSKINTKIRRPLPDPEACNSSYISKDKKKANDSPKLSKEVKNGGRYRTEKVDNEDSYVLPNTTGDQIGKVNYCTPK